MPLVTALRLRDTCRLIPTRYPVAGILDQIASPGDLEAILELESWTNDRIWTELGLLRRLPLDEWVTGHPMASVVMAAFCHPRPEGSRFNGPERGAWYAAVDLATAHGENSYHRSNELAEIGVTDTAMQFRLYFADFDAKFHDIRAVSSRNTWYHDPASYAASQALAQELLAQGSNGIVYRSVRHRGGECIACFRPRLVANVRIAGHFEYRWAGTRRPEIQALTG